MLAIVPSLVLALSTAAMFVAALGSAGGTIDYPVVVTAGAFLCALAAAVPRARAALATTGSAERARRERMGGGTAARIAAFSVVWISYVVALPWLGFIACSIVALVASLWIASGRLGIMTVVGPVVFVLVLAVLVSVVLYVPVPKAPLDYALDEFVFTLLGGGL